MRKTKVFLLLFTVLLLTVIPAARVYAEADQLPESWMAGASSVIITPLKEHLENNFYLGGYGFGKSRGPAEGVRYEIFARSMALSDGTTTVVLTVLDLPGIGCSDLEKIRSMAAVMTGIDIQNILVSVTHTHAGPDLQGLWGGVPGEYREYVHERAAASAAEAVNDLQPVHLFYGVSDYSEGLINRRGYDTLDSALHLLHARSHNDEPVATMSVFGAHTTFLDASNMMVSPDFSGKYLDFLENELGGTAVFVPGIQGDQTPVRGDMSINEYARDLGEAAMIAYENAAEIQVPVLDYHYREFPLRVTNPVFIAAYFLRYLSGYNVNFSLRDGFTINTGISFFSIGDEISVATVPGEILSMPGFEIMDISPADNTVVIGLTNGTLGYFVHEEQWIGGIPFLNRGYEESVSMGRHAWPAVREQFKKIFQPETR